MHLSDSSYNFEEELLQNDSFLLLLAKKYTRSVDEAKDLVQDVNLKALKYRKAFTPGTNFKGWLTTILKTTYINKYYNVQKKRFFSELEETTLICNKSLDPSIIRFQYMVNERVNHQLSDNYKKCLLELTPDHRILIFLCDFEGFSYSQIAEFTGSSVSTVRTKLYRSRKKMQSIYMKTEIEK